MKEWKNNLTKLTPYEAGKQISGQNVIKLNANENPYPPSPAVAKVLQKFNCEGLRKYPPLKVSSLDEAIAEYHGVSTDNVFTANSSDEVLAMCFRGLFNSGKPVFFPDITYSFYPVWCSFYDIPFTEIPVNDVLEVVASDYTDTDNGGVIIPNPNAPTAMELDMDVIEKIVSGNSSSVVVMDEAYADFGEVSAVDLIKKYDNLLVTRTMSKGRSLAGLRVGYALGSRELISALGAAMYSFNAYPLSSISIAVAEASIKDEEYFQDVINRVKTTRDKTMAALREKGFVLTDSRANFLFMRHKKIVAVDLYNYLFEKKILVRHFKNERIKNYLRVSIGTDEEMKKFLDAVDNYMEDRDVI